MSVVLENHYDPNYEPTTQEVDDYGKWLGLELPADVDLLWIAREGLKAPLPENWKACKSEKGELYYFNFKSGQSMWDHPMDEHYKQLARTKREELTAAKVAAAAAAQMTTAVADAATKAASGTKKRRTSSPVVTVLSPPPSSARKDHTAPSSATASSSCGAPVKGKKSPTPLAESTTTAPSPAATAAGPTLAPLELKRGLLPPQAQKTDLPITQAAASTPGSSSSFTSGTPQPAALPKKAAFGVAAPALAAKGGVSGGTAASPVELPLTSPASSESSSGGGGTATALSTAAPSSLAMPRSGSAGRLKQIKTMKHGGAAALSLDGGADTDEGGASSSPATPLTQAIAAAAAAPQAAAQAAALVGTIVAKELPLVDTLAVKWQRRMLAAAAFQALAASQRYDIMTHAVTVTAQSWLDEEHGRVEQHLSDSAAQHRTAIEPRLEALRAALDALSQTSSTRLQQAQAESEAAVAILAANSSAELTEAKRFHQQQLRALQDANERELQACRDDHAASLHRQTLDFSDRQNELKAQLMSDFAAKEADMRHVFDLEYQRLVDELRRADEDEDCSSPQIDSCATSAALLGPGTAVAAGPKPVVPRATRDAETSTDAPPPPQSASAASPSSLSDEDALQHRSLSSSSVAVVPRAPGETLHHPFEQGAAILASRSGSAGEESTFGSSVPLRKDQSALNGAPDAGAASHVASGVVLSGASLRSAIVDVLREVLKSSSSLASAPGEDLTATMAATTRQTSTSAAASSLSHNNHDRVDVTAPLGTTTPPRRTTAANGPWRAGGDDSEAFTTPAAPTARFLHPPPPHQVGGGAPMSTLLTLASTLSQQHHQPVPPRTPMGIHEQRVLIAQERCRLDDAAVFVEQQREALDARRRALKAARSNWKRDVLSAKERGVSASSKKAAVLRRIEMLLKQQAEGLEHDERLLADTSGWLAAKAQRLLSMESELELGRLEASRGVGGAKRADASADALHAHKPSGPTLMTAASPLSREAWRFLHPAVQDLTIDEAAESRPLRVAGDHPLPPSAPAVVGGRSRPPTAAPNRASEGIISRSRSRSAGARDATRSSKRKTVVTDWLVEASHTAVTEGVPPAPAASSRRASPAGQPPSRLAVRDVNGKEPPLPMWKASTLADSAATLEKPSATVPHVSRHRGDVLHHHADPSAAGLADEVPRRRHPQRSAVAASRTHTSRRTVSPYFEDALRRIESRLNEVTVMVRGGGGPPPR